ncbi:MAG: T9SS type A sorting domain-containing protein, partial [Bacteroidota bacterium]|nr:T9SS type A sorting domain-containing protein [Bacteroidota bacterium]
VARIDSYAFSTKRLERVFVNYTDSLPFLYRNDSIFTNPNNAVTPIRFFFSKNDLAIFANFRLNVSLTQPLNLTAQQVYWMRNLITATNHDWSYVHLNCLRRDLSKEGWHFIAGTGKQLNYLNTNIPSASYNTQNYPRYTDTNSVLDGNTNYFNLDFTALNYDYENNVWASDYLRVKDVDGNPTPMSRGYGYMTFFYHENAMGSYLGDGVALQNYFIHDDAVVTIDTTNRATEGNYFSPLWFALGNPYKHSLKAVDLVGRKYSARTNVTGEPLWTTVITPGSLAVTFLDNSQLTSEYFGYQALPQFPIQGATVYVYNRAGNGEWSEASEIYPGEGFMVASPKEGYYKYSSTSIEGTDATGTTSITIPAGWMQWHTQHNEEITHYSNVNRLCGFIKYTAPTTGGGTGVMAAPAEPNSNVEVPEIKFTVEANDLRSEMFASQDGNDGFDIGDVYALFANNENLVEPYFVVENVAIKRNRYTSDVYTCPVGFHTQKAANAKLSVSNIPDGTTVSIIDLATEQETVLEENNSFEFDVQAGENTERYLVKIAKSTSSLTQVVKKESISIWNDNKEISIKGKELKQVELYNTLGQMVYQRQISGDNYNFTYSHAGAYIVKVTANNETKSQKIVIK